MKLSRFNSLRSCTILELAFAFHCSSEMGCLNNFVSPQKLLDSDELEECDIIEFNRFKYSHFGFYIGDGICVHLTGPDSQSGFSSPSPSSSLSLSSKFPKGCKQAQLLLDIANSGPSRLYNKVRVNNCVMLAAAFGARERPKEEAIELALQGLERDSNGKVILEKPIAYKYDLVNDNCEDFSTRCRYRHHKGFSNQVANWSMSSTLGTVERHTSATRDELAYIIVDKDTNIVVRGAAAVGYVAETAAGWTAYVGKTAGDAAVSALTALMGRLPRTR